MNVQAVVLAAGRGERFGADKLALLLGEKPLWKWSFDTLQRHPRIASVGIMASEESIESIRSLAQGAAFISMGGATRQETSRLASACLCSEATHVLIHDGARPFVSHELIDRVLDALQSSPAVCPGVPLTDTIRVGSDHTWRTLDRSQCRAIQTPQGLESKLLVAAHLAAKSEYTDEMALVESLGTAPMIVEGDPQNFKITTPADFRRAEAMAVPTDIRTGIGYDIHRFSGDPGRSLWLGGVKFEGVGLAGHSDADVVLHAIADAVLGAAGLGDIGRMFPDTDPQWKDMASIRFLEQIHRQVADAGWQVRNIDVTVIAEAPKIMPKVEHMQEVISQALGIGVQVVNIKATTNEGLGSIGRGEGIAAFATATIARMLGG